MGKVIRWNLARNKAIQTLAKFNISIFPLELFQLIDKIPHLEIMSYIEMCEELSHLGYLDGKVTVAWVQEHLADGSQDAALLRMSNSLDTIILYNSDLLVYGHTEQRIRYSIAHEIGHFILKHKFQTMIARNGISAVVYNAFEKEAEAFAASLLMPYGTFPSKVSVAELREKYDVSKKAAEIMFDAVSKQTYALPAIRLNHYGFSHPRQYTLPSNPFSIFGFKYYAYCKNCHGLTGGNSPNLFCSYCGSKLTALSFKYGFFKIHEEFGGSIMKYSEIKTDSSGHAVECPQCGSEIDTTDQYCAVCGIFLINQCTGIYETNDPFAMPTEHISFEQKTNSGCGRKLPGYARYCTGCGALSTFGFQNLLQNWQKEYMDANPMKIAEITDQDLPF